MTHFHHKLAQPWATPNSLYSVPGRFVVKLALGEAPEAIPALRDVRLGASQPATSVDRGPFDRIMDEFTDAYRVSRLHSSAKFVQQAGRGHEDFDDVEHAIGISRTLYCEVDDDCAIGDLLDALRHLAIVEEVSPHYLCTVPFSAAVLSYEEDWEPREMIHGREAMAFEPGDATVIVGIVDTGVERQHPELRRRLRAGFNTVDFDGSDLSTGIHLVGDWTGPDTNPEDFVGHGTSCAGIIGAEGRQIPPGLAGECLLLPIRVLAAAMMPGKEEPIGIGAITDIDVGVKRAIDLNAKVINMSFGTPESAIDPGDMKPHSDVVRYGAARRCVMVAASGNSGSEEKYYPAAHPGVIAVGAVDNNRRPSTFSTRGDHVAISGPGEGIVSAGLQGYCKASGTSFSGPFVSATAALLVSYAEGRAEPIDGEDAKRILQESAQPFANGADAHGCGAGILDANAALRALEREINRKTQRAKKAAGVPSP